MEITTNILRFYIEKELKLNGISCKQMARDLSLSPTYVMDILNRSRGLGTVGKKRVQEMYEYVDKLKEERKNNKHE